MAEENLPQVGGIGFEDLKKANDYGAEYWSARDLQPLLGYNHWRSFEKAIQKAVTSCEQSGNEPSYHFARRANRSLVERGQFKKWAISIFPVLPAT